MNAPISRLSRAASGWLLGAVFALGVAVPHRHSLSEDFSEGGFASPDHEHVLTSHNPLSRSTHFHAVLGIEHDSCVACHGTRGIGRPVQNTRAARAESGERPANFSSAHPFESALRTPSSRGPPASV